MDQKINIVSFNCRSIKRTEQCIFELCSKNDILLLQETWLLPSELGYLANIHPDFQSTGTSAVNLSNGPLVGRPHGGVAILWRSTMQAIVIDCNEPRITGIELSLKSGNILILTIYMPTHNIVNLPEFSDLLSKVNAIIEEKNANNSIIIGDFNADPKTIFGRELEQFCNDNHYKYCDKINLAEDSFTYLSDAHGSTSWLDHCISTEGIQNAISNFRIMYEIIWSDHFPVALTIDAQLLPPIKNRQKSPCNPAIWRAKTDADIRKFSQFANISMTEIILLSSNMCDSEQCCVNDKHKTNIDSLYNHIIMSLSKAAENTFKKPVLRNKAKVIPGWNNRVAEKYANAREAFFEWKLGGKPTDGPISNQRKITRKIFQKALKECRQQEDQARMDAIATSLQNSDFKTFWKGTTNVVNYKSKSPLIVNGISGDTNIANEFKTFFAAVSEANTEDKNETSTQHPDHKKTCDDQIIIKPTMVIAALKKMSSGKSPGHDGLTIEHLRHGGQNIPIVLGMLFTNIIKHAYIPAPMTKTIVIPILKSNSLDSTILNNYRPISMATIIARIFERVLLNIIEPCLKTEDNQFGFKPASSTEMAIFSVKQTIEYYLHRETPIYACFLDLSKAFDRVSHKKLWGKLSDRNTPKSIINVLCLWHKQQENVIQWAGCLSKPYVLKKGVRQGGAMSPVLFNLYMDDLSTQLNATKVGCFIGGISTNNISYADDMVLLAPSLNGLRRLIAICEQYAESHDMIYNETKSVVMVFRCKKSPSVIHPIQLNKKTLQVVSKVKYLGHIITADLKDGPDIDRQRQAISIRAGMLARRFHRCTSPVKRILFNAYCTNLYTADLWIHYTQAQWNAIRVQYNNAYRQLFRLPWYCSASEMFTSGRVNSFYATMRHKVANSRCKLLNSRNIIIKAAIGWLNAPLQKNWMLQKPP